jgi:hypothetical protein
MKTQVQAAMHIGFFQQISLFLLLFLLSPFLLAEGHNVVLLTALRCYSVVYTNATATITVTFFLLYALPRKCKENVSSLKVLIYNK